MATLFTRIRFVAGALALAVMLAAGAPAAARSRSIRPRARSRRSSCSSELNRITGRCTLPDQKACTHRAAGRPRLAPLPPGDAAAGSARIAILGMLALLVVFYLIRGMVRIEAGRSGRVDRALQRLRAPRALDDGDLLHHPRALRPQHHLRQAAAAAADRAGGVHRLVAMGEIRPQLSELPVHARRGADLPDVDRLEHPEQGRRRMAQGGRRHRRPQASAGRPLQRRPEDDLLDRRARRRRGGGHRLSPDVPVLRRPTSPACSSPRSSTASSAVLFVAAMLAHIYIGTIGMEGAFEAMGTAPSTSTGRRSTTASGSSRNRPRARATAPPPEGKMQPAE